MSVLIVEDEESYVDALELALHREGFESRVARTGPEAVRMFDEQSPDLVGCVGEGVRDANVRVPGEPTLGVEPDVVVEDGGVDVEIEGQVVLDEVLSTGTHVKWVPVVEVSPQSLQSLLGDV